MKVDDDPPVRKLEHRVVMARHLGRPLLPTDTVRYGPGGRIDNRRENLTPSGSNAAPCLAPREG